MQTIQLDIKDEELNTFLTIVKNLKSGMIENIRTQNDILDVETIEKESTDYIELETIKAQNNKKYTLDEAKKMLGI
ncbi:MAG: hypothetical protein L3J41_07875 [Melioribacteraceae bacterium]|nr:hypothetical protein [Melioribacteraceae bacterium]